MKLLRQLLDRLPCNAPIAVVLPALLLLAGPALAADPVLHSFKRLVLSEQFFSEGACFADLDGDGDQDIISGPYWYAGPDFRRRHAYAPATPLDIRGYSDFFFSFAYDFNSDSRIDILAIGMPGRVAHWYENPGRSKGHWEKHVAIDDVGNESPQFSDLTGDGRPELVCCRGGAFGYAESDPDMPSASWKFTPVTPANGYGGFTHGLGIGDVDGDGRLDLLETNGWWRQEGKKGELFRFHPVRFARSGGAQMFAYDFDGDGDNDVLSVQNAHGYGLSWFEQVVTANGKRRFEGNSIITSRPVDSPYGLSISQMHAVALVDVDGDGVRDIVTGKRFWAHAGGDPGSQQLPVLYWFRTNRSRSGTRFEPRLIDDRSGVGTQLVTGDISGNGLPDIVVGSKMGTYLMLHESRRVTAAELEAARPKRR
ncbi:MAG: VCBS repeat-containing protein, partial [Planctomycetota bacterium]